MEDNGVIPNRPGGQTDAHEGDEGLSPPPPQNEHPGLIALLHDVLFGREMGSDREGLRRMESDMDLTPYGRRFSAGRRTAR